MAKCDILLISLLLFSLSPISSNAAADQYIYGGCSSISYSSDTSSSYDQSLDNMLTSIANSATFQPYNNFTIGSSNPQQVIYGLYQCRGDIAMPDCAICVQQAVSQFHELCHDQNCGGVIMLEGCFIKYDNSTFLGQLDKDVVLRKCGPSPDGYDSEAKSKRDAVLAGLLGSGQSYKISGSENIQSVAQCVGDLNQDQCGECVNEAIRKIKQECFMATYGDMFLGKCYVRYTINRAHSPSSAGNQNIKINRIPSHIMLLLLLYMICTTLLIINACF